jgi:small-conductance mechanosensitive channel
MDKFLVALGGLVVIVLIVMVIAALFAFPTMWLFNYLFAPSFLTAVFGVSKLTFWRAMFTNMFFGWFVKGTSTSTSK